MPATSPAELRIAARKHAETAIRTLVGIMTSSRASETARIAAVKVLFDRGFGRVGQPFKDSDDHPQVTRLVRKFVTPEDVRRARDEAAAQGLPPPPRVRFEDSE
jgi:hypothetical protein